MFPMVNAFSFDGSSSLMSFWIARNFPRSNWNFFPLQTSVSSDWHAASIFYKDCLHFVYDVLVFVCKGGTSQSEEDGAWEQPGRKNHDDSLE